MGRRARRVDDKAEEERQGRSESHTAFTCAHCGEPKPIALYLVHPDGKREPLCQVCATRWLLSDEPWPPEEESKNV